MSQSEMHRRLVTATATAIRKRHPMVRILSDFTDSPGDPLPPLIGGFRPDIVALCNAACLLHFIAEAKTDGDINNRHTRNQISAFVNHLETLPSGTGVFILAVNGEVADTARSVLRFACRPYVSPRLHVKLFDGLDFWTLGPLGTPLWRLS